MIYFDYDGVIGNTEEGLFDEYERQKENLEGITKRQYLINMDWYDWLRKKGPRGNAFEVLRKHDPKEACILTSCCSIKEGESKIIYLRENFIRNSIIIVPIDIPKYMVVEPRHNLLVEDNLDNAIGWLQNGGQALIVSKKPVKVCKNISSLEQAFEYAKKMA
ncbi:MAG: hypothetical protein IKR04_00625 [Clostridia bacterium]|nr:hypothetical protein [Clostridia bacterium]